LKIENQKSKILVTYRSSILSFSHGCGVVVFLEVHTCLGRSDLVIAHRGVSWAIEINVAYKGDQPAKKAEEALRQIEIKNTQFHILMLFVSVWLLIDDSVRQITNWEIDR